MTFIRTVPPEEAAGPVREHYDRDLHNLGYIANYTQAFSLRPEVLSAWRALLRAIRGSMDLRRYELVTVIAAARLRCTY